MVSLKILSDHIIVIFTVTFPGYSCREEFEVVNGNVIITNSFHVQPIYVTAQVTCRKGFERFGASTLKCIYNFKHLYSHWNVQYPVCRSEF